MTYNTFLGWNVIPMPTSPAPRSVNVTMHDTVGENRSPFTNSQWEQVWPGGDWWELEVQLPPLTAPQARTWFAWFAAMRGKASVFPYIDRWHRKPMGTPLGNPTTVTNTTWNQATATSINTTGWTANKNNLLLPGDRMQLNQRLHMVAGVAPVISDASGSATIEVWPSLREPANGVQVITSNCAGMFRLADNKRQISENYTRLFGLSFKAIEAK